MHTSATSLLKLINDILDFSKIQAGKLEINPRPSGIRAEVASLRPLFKSEAESKGLNLVLEVSPNVPKSVTIDVDRFKQIAINLIGYCITFSDTIKVCMRIDYEHNDASRSDRLLVEVFDTGVGISDESREKLFKSFTQGNAGYNRDYGGTGLGLSIARQLIDLMQGALSMESEVGKGTTFNLAIPIHGQIEPSGSKDRTEHPTNFLKVFDGSNVDERKLAHSSGEVFELRRQIEHVAQCIVDGKGPHATGLDGIWSVGMCLAAEESFAIGQPVDVSDFMRPHIASLTHPPVFS